MQQQQLKDWKEENNKKRANIEKEYYGKNPKKKALMEPKELDVTITITMRNPNIFLKLFKIMKEFIENQFISTLNRIFNGIKTLKGLIVEKCRCLEHDVQALYTSITIDVQ